MQPDRMLKIALDYASVGYQVFPLAGKIPAIPTAHRDGDPMQGKCKGECGRDGHGVLDATADLAKVEAWWTGRPSANIGVRVPEPLFVVDIDPRNEGEASFAKLVDEHGPFPLTRVSFSGRCDGGRHFWFLHPGGKLSSSRLGAGIDVKTHSGYVVVPPSIHPDTGHPYTWDEPLADPVAPPAWLLKLLRPAVPTIPRSTYVGTGGDTIADRLSWADILGPERWSCISADPDADGARWLHPAATSALSATVRNGCLFVYSTNTPFEPTEASSPRGYTKLRAYATLHHRGDCKAAWRDLAKRLEVSR